MDTVFAIVFTLFVWWFSTGAVLYLVGMPSQTFGVSMLTATAAAGLALFGLVVTSGEQTVASAFCAFSCALVVWAWHEMSFLTGFVTGSRTTACPKDVTGWTRFVVATQTLIYHEVAIAVTAVAIAWFTWDAPNQYGLWTFLVLWIARLSAKFNVFLGVPNLSEEFLAPHLKYLATYFRRRPMNMLFPVSVTLSTLATATFVIAAAAPAATDFETAGWTLIATMGALAVIEHWFLVVPLPAAALWSWGLKSRAPETSVTHNIVPLSRPIRETAQCEDISGGRHAV
ncbi:MAG: putative photosynthetic complex assembly protein PuhE [Hyphomicrobiaceae bacterium]|nr:putative photosynthetic complex assembly protein PuhE [Hyphomicrobiaceae bacterium]